VPTVIKAGDALQVERQIRPVDLADHLAEASQVVERARREAAALVEQGKREADELRAGAREAGQQEGHKAGWDAGWAAGHQQAREEARQAFETRHLSMVQALQAATATLDGQRESLALQGERDLLRFAMRVAGELTFAVGRTYPEAAVANLRRCLERVQQRCDLVVYAHPQDLETLKEFATKEWEALGEGHAVRFEADESMAPGGCKVTGRETEVDASLDTQIEQLVQLFLGGGCEATGNEARNEAHTEACGEERNGELSAECGEVHAEASPEARGDEPRGKGTDDPLGEERDDG
jgi:flagellar assembly protein FliH